MVRYKPIAVVLAAVALGSGLGAGILRVSTPAPRRRSSVRRLQYPLLRPDDQLRQLVTPAVRDSVVEITVTGAAQGTPFGGGEQQRGQGSDSS